MTQISDTEQAQSGKVLKVGISQLNNETPLFAKYIFRTVLFLSGLWALLSGQLELPILVVAAINKWLLVGNTVLNFSIKFFGWDMPEPSNINDRLPQDNNDTNA